MRILILIGWLSIHYSCKIDQDTKPEIVPTCSYQSLDYNGYLKNKIFNDRFETLNYKNLEVRRLKFQPTNFSTSDNIGFEVIKNNKIYYLADTTGVEFHELRDHQYYEVKGCFLDDLNNHILKGLSKKSKIEFLTIFHTLRGSEIYRKRLPRYGKPIYVDNKSIELPSDVNWSLYSEKVLLIRLEYGLYKLYHVDSFSKISAFIVKPEGMGKIYRF